MGKYAQIEDIQIAGSFIPLVNVNTMLNWQSEMINDKKYIPQIFYRDAYWVSIQDLISAVADEKEIQILAKTVKCEYNESLGELKLFLHGSWSLEQLECLNEAFAFIPCKGSKDISFNAFEQYIVVFVKFEEQ